MSRKRKFRGWIDNENAKIQVKLKYFEFDDDGNIKEIAFESMSGCIVWTKAENIILEDYTEHTDCLDQEIYHGDIIEFTVFDHNDNDTQYKGVVIWEDGWQVWNSLTRRYYGNSGPFDFIDVHQGDMELKRIGNMHETPDILEGK